MTPNILNEVVSTVRALNEEQQREVLEYAKKIGETEETEKDQPTQKKKIWEKLDDLMKTLPKDAFEGYPKDGSLNHDHYLYGSPKKEQK